jgi:hypothetical protein
LDIHLDADLSFVYGAIALLAGIDVNPHQNAKSSMEGLPNEQDRTELSCRNPRLAATHK